MDVDIEQRPELADPEAAPPEIKQVNNICDVPAALCCCMLSLDLLILLP